MLPVFFFLSRFCAFLRLFDSRSAGFSICSGNYSVSHDLRSITAHGKNSQSFSVVVNGSSFVAEWFTSAADWPRLVGSLCAQHTFFPTILSCQECGRDGGGGGGRRQHVEVTPECLVSLSLRFTNGMWGVGGVGDGGGAFVEVTRWPGHTAVRVGGAMPSAAILFQWWTRGIKREVTTPLNRLASRRRRWMWAAASGLVAVRRRLSVAPPSPSAFVQQ